MKLRPRPGPARDCSGHGLTQAYLNSRIYLEWNYILNPTLMINNNNPNLKTSPAYNITGVCVGGTRHVGVIISAPLALITRHVGRQVLYMQLYNFYKKIWVIVGPRILYCTWKFSTQWKEFIIITCYNLHTVYQCG